MLLGMRGWLQVNKRLVFHSSMVSSCNLANAFLAPYLCGSGVLTSKRPRRQYAISSGIVVVLNGNPGHSLSNAKT